MSNHDVINDQTAFEAFATDLLVSGGIPSAKAFSHVESALAGNEVTVTLVDQTITGNNTQSFGTKKLEEYIQNNFCMELPTFIRDYSRYHSSIAAEELAQYGPQTRPIDLAMKYGGYIIRHYPKIYVVKSAEPVCRNDIWSRFDTDDNEALPVALVTSIRSDAHERYTSNRKLPVNIVGSLVLLPNLEITTWQRFNKE